MAKITKRQGDLFKVTFPVSYAGYERTVQVGFFLSPAKTFGHGRPEELPWFESRTLHLPTVSKLSEMNVVVTMKLPMDMPTGNYDVLRWVADPAVIGDPQGSYFNNKKDDDWDDDVLQVNAAAVVNGEPVDPNMNVTIKNGIATYSTPGEVYGPAAPEPVTASPSQLGSGTVYSLLLGMYGSRVAEVYLERVKAGTAPAFYVGGEDAVWAYGQLIIQMLHQQDIVNGTVSPNQQQPSSTISGEDPLQEVAASGATINYTPVPGDGGVGVYVPAYIMQNIEEDQAYGYSDPAAQQTPGQVATVPVPDSSGQLPVEWVSVPVGGEGEGFITTAPVPSPTGGAVTGTSSATAGTWECTYVQSSTTKWRGWAADESDARAQAKIQAVFWTVKDAKFIG